MLQHMLEKNITTHCKIDCPYLGASCMEEAVPVVQMVVEQGRGGANVQVAGLC